MGLWYNRAFETSASKVRHGISAIFIVGKSTFGLYKKVEQLFMRNIKWKESEGERFYQQGKSPGLFCFAVLSARTFVKIADRDFSLS